MSLVDPVNAFFEEEWAKRHHLEPNKLFANTEWVQDFLCGRKVPPITLEMDITLHCNDRCPDCVQIWALQPRELSIEQIKGILCEAKEFGIKGLTFTGGGDPLMHSRIFEVIELVRQSGLHTGIYTNGGMLMVPGLAEALISTFAWVRISLDSGKNTFNLVRGHTASDAYAKRMRCVGRLAEARQKVGGQCMIGASFLTSALVVQDILQATKDVREAGLDYLQFKPMIKWNLATNHHGSVIMDQTGVYAAILEASRIGRDGFRVIGSPSKYEATVLHRPRIYSQYHASWVVAAVAPNMIGPIKPTLYLECSVKYLDRWKIGEFENLTGVLASEARRNMIKQTSSDVYCVLPEKGVTYSHMLDAVIRRNEKQSMTNEEIRSLAPELVEHPYSL